MLTSIYRSIFSYDLDKVPYERMWADDVVWMATLLASAASYFEGHFVFDGGPGAESKLLRHNWCQRSSS